MLRPETLAARDRPEAFAVEGFKKGLKRGAIYGILSRAVGSIEDPVSLRRVACSLLKRLKPIPEEGKHHCRTLSLRTNSYHAPRTVDRVNCPSGVAASAGILLSRVA